MFSLCIRVLCIAQLIAGCAQFRPTPYQPSIEGGYGYKDERIGVREYRITVSGNAATSAEILWNQVLLRAAEITLATGHQYYIVTPNGAGELVDVDPAFLTPQFGIGSGPTRLIQYEGYPVSVVPSRQLVATATIKVTKRKLGGDTTFLGCDAKKAIRLNGATC